mgnify:CR=1 FL=1
MSMTQAEALARIAELEAKLAEANKPRSLSIKIGPSGTVCVYGMGRYPTSLYGTQWARLAEFMPTILAFLRANPQTMTPKGEAKPVVSLTQHQAARAASGLPV